MKTFSELERKLSPGDNDLVPIVDTYEDDPALQNKTMQFVDIKDYFMGYITPSVETATAAASAADAAKDIAEAAATDLAEQYSTSATYAVGDYVLYNGALYRCTTAITTAEAWTPAHWSAAKVSGELSDLKSAYRLLNNEIPDTVQTYTFTDGSVTQVLHKSGNVTVRTDSFTYTTNMITEVRTLNTGESLTIATNLTTLETTVTYAAA